MNISIPDKISKLFILIGFISIGYAISYKENKRNEYLTKNEHIINKQDSIFISYLKTSDVLKETLDKSEILKNEINDSIKLPEAYLQNELAIIQKNLDENKYAYLSEKFKILSINKEALYNTYMQDYKWGETILKLGLFIFIMGLLLWIHDVQRKILQRKINEKAYSNCQSCGDEFNSMKKYGTEVNLDLNYAFCKDCYENGNFTNPELTKEDLISSTYTSLNKKNYFSKLMVKSRFANLERWKRFSNSGHKRFMYFLRKW